MHHLSDKPASGCFVLLHSGSAFKSHATFEVPNFCSACSCSNYHTVSSRKRQHPMASNLNFEPTHHHMTILTGKTCVGVFSKFVVGFYKTVVFAFFCLKHNGIASSENCTLNTCVRLATRLALLYPLWPEFL